MTVKRIAILMACHNRKRSTLSCLQAINELNPHPNAKVSIYLFDDGSTDGTKESIAENFPEVKILTGDGSYYWNRGMLACWKFALTREYDYYLWLNDDTTLLKDALDSLLSGIDQVGEESIICGTTMSFLDNDIITYGGYHLGIHHPIRPSGTYVACDYFNGNVALIPAAVVNKIGLLDSFFHHALGDFDYGLRARKHLIQAYITPFAVGYCEQHLDTPRWSNPSYALSKRLKHFFSPLGPDPLRLLVFEWRHLNKVKSLVHFMGVFMTLLFPKRKV